MSRIAKDVARELDKRQRRRRMSWLGVWAVLIVLAVTYLRCGRGWGTGDGDGSGSGSGKGSSTSTSTSTNEKRCNVRVGSEGVTLEGKAAKREAVVAKCKAVDVVVTGDAREGEWKQLCNALDAAHVAIVMHSDAKVCPP
jgi:hypothetical protein